MKNDKSSSGMHELELILDIGVALLRNGAETWRTEMSLYRLAESYGFTKCDFWVVPSNIQGCVTDREGQCLTQIRNIRNIGIDFTRLEDLNALSRRTCELNLGADQVRRELDSIVSAKEQPVWLQYAAGILAGAGFGVFFHCDILDAAVAAIASVLITLLGRSLRRKEHTPMILNFIISFVAEIFIVCAVSLGFGHHTSYITMGIVMLLISALGATNGIRDLVHLDTVSGVMNLTQSLTGAAGIALGMAVPLLLFRTGAENEIVTLADSPWIQLGACAVGCVGFSFWFKVKSVRVIPCVIGSLLIWGLYLVFLQSFHSRFVSAIAATAICAIYSQSMARILKAPATVFQTIAIFPLIPGSALYYMMYGLVIRDFSLAVSKGMEMVIICSGIVLGLMAVEIVIRMLFENKRKKT